MQPVLARPLLRHRLEARAPGRPPAAGPASRTRRSRPRPLVPSAAAQNAASPFGSAQSVVTMPMRHAMSTSLSVVPMASVVAADASGGHRQERVVHEAAGTGATAVGGRRYPSQGADQDVVAVPADPARGPGRRGGAEPQAARPRRLRPPRRAGDLLLAAAGAAGAARRRAGGARGDGRHRRPGDPVPRAAAARAVRGHEPVDRVRPEHLPAQGPQGRRLPARAHPRGAVHARSSRASTRPTRTTRSSSTRSRPSTATRSGRARASCAGGSSS